MNATPSESVHTLSGAYVVDALDDAERAQFEAHLPGCRDCRVEVAGLREATALMADAAAVAPPPGLRDNVLAGIRSVRPLPPEGPGPAPEQTAAVVPIRRRRFRLAAMATAAAVAAAVGVGVVVERPWQDDTSTTLTAADRVLAAPDAEKVSIDFDDGSRATVVRSTTERRAVILTRDMAAPPPGKAFEVWLQDDTGKMLPAGLMKTAGDHKVLLEGDAAKATGVGITVEPETGSEQPTSEPIALFDLSEAKA